jgi:nucleotide-binding universal stress UspA family protein
MSSSRSILVTEKLPGVRRLAQDFSKMLGETVELRPGSATEEILERMHQQPRPELLVMSSPEQKGLEKILIGTVAEEVILKSNRPVMVLGPSAQDLFLEKGLRRPMRILMATDLTRASRPAEQYAASLAARCRAQLVFFHSPAEQIRSIQQAIYSSGYAAFDMESTLQRILKDARQRLEKKKKRCRQNMIACDILLGSDKSGLLTDLLQETDKHFSWIVMGTHSRSLLMRALMGSTAKEVLQRAKVPVVVVAAH